MIKYTVQQQSQKRIAGVEMKHMMQLTLSIASDKTTLNIEKTKYKWFDNLLEIDLQQVPVDTVHQRTNRNHLRD